MDDPPRKKPSEAKPARPAPEPAATLSVPGKSNGNERRIPDELPILPLRDTVVFPGTIVPLNIGRPKSKRVVEQAVGGDRLIGVVLQKDKQNEDPAPDDLHAVGTACMILKLITLPDGAVSIMVHGLTRFRVESFPAREPVLKARIALHEDAAEPSSELDALVHNARELAYRLFELSPNVPDEARIVLDNIETPGGVGDFLGANVAMELPERQEVLETFDVAQRLRKVSTAMTRQIDLLELSGKIQSQVRDQIDKSQREYYLQEQLKAIQKELGEADGRSAEMQRLRERVEEADLPEAAKTEAERELTRLERIPQASPEYSVALDYLNWLCELPWSTGTTDRLDLRRAERVLDEDHYDLEKVKKRILEFLAVRKLKPDGRGPILCFLGPPGVGKTSLGQSIARALERKFVRMSLGGLHDEAQLRGHRRTYIGSMPGRIIQEIRKAGSNNPVFMLDEVDKLGRDFRGDPSSALLEILDPAQNHTFTDNYLDVPFDLSRVMFIATGNYAEAIPGPLRDRMETIELSGYTTREKTFISRRYLVPRQLDEHGLKRKHLTFTEEALTKIASSYTREAGVRELERQIGTVVRAVAARVVRGRRKAEKITPDKLRRYLGPERFDHEVARRTSVPGVATGLAFTPTGGEILFIEATTMPGKGNLTLTGQLGDVMRESAQAAYSVVRSRAEALRIDPEHFTKSDVHLHVPAGAIPKDGPSAGVAMFTAVVSLLTERPCRHDVGMTGEITLSGRVLPVGGLKDKVIAAHRAGITRVILPANNRKDLTDIPTEVRRQVRFTFAEDVERVLNVALERGTKRRPARRRRKKPASSS